MSCSIVSIPALRNQNAWRSQKYLEAFSFGPSLTSTRVASDGSAALVSGRSCVYAQTTGTLKRESLGNADYLAQYVVTDTSLPLCECHLLSPCPEHRRHVDQEGVLLPAVLR